VLCRPTVTDVSFMATHRLQQPFVPFGPRLPTDPLSPLYVPAVRPEQPYGMFHQNLRSSISSVKVVCRPPRWRELANIQMLLNRCQVTPDYVLLMGDGTFFKVRGTNASQKKYRKILWCELATVTSQALKYDVINFCLPACSSNFMQNSISPQRPLTTPYISTLHWREHINVTIILLC